MKLPKSKRLLILLLGSVVIAWLIAMLATHADMIVGTPYAAEAVLGETPQLAITPSRYLNLLAILVVVMTTLFTKRQSARLLNIPEASDPAEARATLFGKQTIGFANVLLIASLAFSTLTVLALFLEAFSGIGMHFAAAQNTLNTYVPILLYTLLIVYAILTGFVFQPKKTTSTGEHAAPGTEPLPQTQPQTYAQPQAQPQAHPQTQPLPQAQPHQEAAKNTALGWSLPIVVTAIALVVGLIIYDVTQTSLTGSIWAIVMLLIGTGIVLGTAFAIRGINIVQPPAGAAVGAKNLGFVLSIIFSIIATIMAFAGGASTVLGLSANPYLSISVYQQGQPGYSGTVAQLALADSIVTYSGTGLQRDSAITLRLNPSGDVLQTTRINQNGDNWSEASLPADLASGKYQLSLEAIDIAGNALSAVIGFEVREAGTAIFEQGTDAWYSPATSVSVTPSAEWALKYLLPNFVLLLTALGVIYFTTSIRSKETTPEQYLSVV